MKIFWNASITLMIALTSTLSFGATTLSCTIWDFVDNPDGTVTVSKQLGDLTLANPFLYVSTGMWLNVQTGVDISFDEESRELFIHIGDFCGERYHESRFNFEGGPVMESFSYGRNAENYWKRIEVECSQQ
jgi:hypothetical protein